jgi:hypothetical protein
MINRSKEASNATIKHQVAPPGTQSKSVTTHHNRESAVRTRWSKICTPRHGPVRTEAEHEARDGRARFTFLFFAVLRRLSRQRNCFVRFAAHHLASSAVAAASVASMSVTGVVKHTRGFARPDAGIMFGIIGRRSAQGIACSVLTSGKQVFHPFRKRGAIRSSRMPCCSR